MIRCCIFDLDGTLLNTLEALNYTVNLVMEHFGYGPVDLSLIHISGPDPPVPPDGR